MQEHWYYDAVGGIVIGGLSLWSVRHAVRVLPNFGPLPNPWPTFPPLWSTVAKPWYLENGFPCSGGEKLLSVYSAIIPKWMPLFPSSNPLLCVSDSADSACVNLLQPHQAFLAGVTRCQQNL